MKPLADYSHIRGFNYTPSYAQNDLDFWNNYRHDVVDRDGLCPAPGPEQRPDFPGL